MYLRVWTPSHHRPPPSLTLTKTYCTRTRQPVHITAPCVAVTSTPDSTLCMCMTDSVSQQVQSLCPQRITVQDRPHPHRHSSSVLPVGPATTGFPQRQEKHRNNGKQAFRTHTGNNRFSPRLSSASGGTILVVLLTSDGDPVSSQADVDKMLLVRMGVELIIANRGPMELHPNAHTVNYSDQYNLSCLSVHRHVLTPSLRMQSRLLGLNCNTQELPALHSHSGCIFTDRFIILG